MKNKILIVIGTIFFIIIMIILSRFLNNRNKVEISNEEESGMEIMKVTSSNFEEEVLNSDKTVLIDFYADWCGPCKMMGHVLENINDIEILKVNVDKHPDISQKYMVMSIPTLLLMENGNIIKSHVGFMNEDELKEFIK